MRLAEYDSNPDCLRPFLRQLHDPTDCSGRFCYFTTGIQRFDCVRRLVPANLTKQRQPSGQLYTRQGKSSAFVMSCTIRSRLAVREGVR